MAFVQLVEVVPFHLDGIADECRVREEPRGRGREYPRLIAVVAAAAVVAAVDVGEVLHGAVVLVPCRRHEVQGEIVLVVDRRRRALLLAGRGRDGVPDVRVVGRSVPGNICADRR